MADQIKSSRLYATFKMVSSHVKTTRRAITLSLLSSAALFWLPVPGAAQLKKKAAEKSKDASKEAKSPFVHRRLWHPVVRPDDLLVVDMSFDNLHIVAGTPAQLARIDPAKPGRLLVRHQPQAIAEEAFQQVADQPLLARIQRDGTEIPLWSLPFGSVTQDPPLSPHVAGSRMAGHSQVVFTMPTGTNSLPYTLSKLLEAWRTWPMSLDSAARPAPSDWRTGLYALARRPLAITRSAPTGAKLVPASPPTTQAVKEKQRPEVGPPSTRTAPKATAVKAAPLATNVFVPHPPGELVTAIELPYRLMQSPLATAGWAHAEKLVTHGTRTELWHTRLGTRASSSLVDDRSPEPLRAIWSPDYHTPAPVFTMSLDGRDRQLLVKLTAGYNESFTPRPAEAKRLMLTALGGWLDLDGSWQADEIDLKQWTHRTALGRDYYVRVVYAGFLFCFGHAASLVKVTERKFEVQSDGGRVAVLRQRFYIIVRDRVRDYARRDFPFKQVEILTKVTPDLAAPDSSEHLFNGAAREAFWPRLGQSDFLFQMVGLDEAGRRVPFSAPLLFVSATRNKQSDLAAIPAHYSLAQNLSRRNRSFNRSVVQFAPQKVDGDEIGDTNIPTERMTFRGAYYGGSVAPDEPPFYPVMEAANVSLPAAQRLLGHDQPVNVKFAESYLSSGFHSTDPAQVFLEILPGGSPLAFGGAGQPMTDKVGGLIQPNLNPSALSRKFGVVAGSLDTFKAGNFDPGAFFAADPTGGAKLLGILPLKDILNSVPLADPAGGAPKFTTIELPDRIETQFHLRQSNLKPYMQIFTPNFGGTSTLTIDCKTVVARGSAEAQTTLTGTLDFFKVNLFGCIYLLFDELHFQAKPGQKPTVKVSLDPGEGVLFGGPLEFINKLRDFIPSNGFGNSDDSANTPSLSVTPSGIACGYSLGLPTIAVGVFSLQNVTLGASFELPFDGKPPGARFNFAERHNPFNLTVSLLGGGGFFALSVGAEGVREIEAALEFGAQICLDVGVATGSVYAKGGFHFYFATDEVEFDCYVEMGGELTVIGLISVSLLFHVGLIYEKLDAANRCEFSGQATLEVEVEVLFFSASVDVTVERKFGGSPADPLFADFITDEKIWQQYCDAFA